MTGRAHVETASTFAAGTAWQLPCALALLVFCSRLWLIAAYGTHLPFYDQWDAEGLHLYLPLLRGELTWQHLLAPHNEHRLALTHLQNLALFKVAGVWSPLLQQGVNAVWYAAIAGTVCHLLTRGLDGGKRASVAAVTAIVLCAPFGWQNALWGFQAHTFHFLALSVLAFLLLEDANPFRARWVAGLGCAALAAFASSGGVITCLAIAVGQGALCLIGRRPARAALPTVLAAVSLALLALLSTAQVPAHAALRARSIQEFGLVALRGLAWPNLQTAAAALVMWTPLIALVARARRSQGSDVPLQTSWPTIAFGALAGVHACAIAYARGAGLPEGAPISRYQEALALGALANVSALVLLKPKPGTVWASRWRGLAVLWCGGLLIGLAQLTAVNLRLHLPFKADSDARQARLLREYSVTRDTRALTAASFHERGHTSPDSIIAVMEAPELKSRLPHPLRPMSEPTLLENVARTLPAWGRWLLGPVFLWFLFSLRYPRPEHTSETLLT